MANFQRPYPNIRAGKRGDVTSRSLTKPSSAPAGEPQHQLQLETPREILPIECAPAGLHMPPIYKN